MKDLESYKVIFWDFDGVILDSMSVRDQGFIEVLKEYPDNQVDKLLEFHRANGGLSRYVKFRYFFENILGESISESEVNGLAQQFSVIMKSILSNPELLIKDSVQFIADNYSNYSMHIVSGSDGEELRYLCEQLKIDHYFLTIEGSPTAKIELVKNILETYMYEKNDCVLIGDSKNDYDAAKMNTIDFAGYNNEELRLLHSSYIEKFR
ncbi:HAD family hydrolase [Fulvivirga ligni]|uniref:HAD family hydrolase n=1 Tax=Fulvivirga ligni TaxID=2904246 RepID=UPI001F39460E|nr:HAD hydrolase-like protein [Fulvivirga ligni]UII23875.1 HAD hydrolase-like protein [Fulvivirga ligni]